MPNFRTLGQDTFFWEKSNNRIKKERKKESVLPATRKAKGSACTSLGPKYL